MAGAPLGNLLAEIGNDVGPPVDLESVPLPPGTEKAIGIEIAVAADETAIGTGIGIESEEVDLVKGIPRVDGVADLPRLAVGRQAAATNTRKVSARNGIEAEKRRIGKSKEKSRKNRATTTSE